MGSNGSGYTRATHDIEGQNDERLDGLLGKVKILKDVSGLVVVLSSGFSLFSRFSSPAIGLRGELEDSS